MALDSEKKRKLLVKLLMKKYQIIKCDKKGCVMAKKGDVVLFREMYCDATTVIGINFMSSEAAVQVANEPCIKYNLNGNGLKKLMHEVWVERFGEE